MTNKAEPIVNHNFLAKGVNRPDLWLKQMAVLADELCQTKKQGEVSARLNQELIKSRIVAEVVDAQLLSGYVSIPQFDRAQNKIEIAASAMGGSGSYLLTSKGAFLYGDENQPVTDLQQVKKCEILKKIVTRHAPKLGCKLKVFQPTL